MHTHKQAHRLTHIRTDKSHIHVRTNTQTEEDRCKQRHMDGRMEEWTEGRTEGRTDGGTDGEEQTNGRTE